MTTQTYDRIEHKGTRLDLVGADGGGLFDPKNHGFEPFGCNVRCERGSVIYYAIEDGDLLLERFVVGLSRFLRNPPEFMGKRGDGSHGWGWFMDGCRQPVPFTGRLWVGSVLEIDVKHGFRPPWNYRDLRELKFEMGTLISDLDCSADVSALRRCIAENPLQTTPPQGLDRYRYLIKEHVEDRKQSNRESWQSCKTTFSRWSTNEGYEQLGAVARVVEKVANSSIADRFRAGSSIWNLMISVKECNDLDPDDPFVYVGGGDSLPKHEIPVLYQNHMGDLVENTIVPLETTRILATVEPLLDRLWNDGKKARLAALAPEL